uniref:Putative disease resistance protein RXW24L n=1 Tax=Aegilops tauschii TaxID=37682 RepID=M8ATU3_AEGTA
MAGVGVGTGAMNSLLGKLTALLSDEYNLLKRVRKEIQFLKCELDRIQAFLHILADMEKFDDLTKKRRDSLRDLSYEMEDCIDRFMDRLGNRDAKRGFIKRTMRRLRTMWTRHDIANLVKDLKARVMEESERNERYKLDESYYSATRTVEIDLRITTLHEEVNGLVAMDGRVKHITALLMDESMELKVVPIVGSGGLGKTTLAMKVYRTIGGAFQCQASVSVSRTLDPVKLLKDILSQVDGDAYKECQSWEKEQVTRKIKQILTGKRYFIVIDDVWKEEHWKLLKSAFPENNNGSRIITTTRITDVANGCCSNSSGQPYKMEPLDDVASRKLFFKRIFSSDDSCPAELKDVSTRILEKCGGLPLAIITFASLLSNKTHKKDEWERLQESIGTGPSLDSDGNLKGMKDILLLSYWDLPHHLKTCLLYLCIYPEDCRIKCEELKWKWVAEGFLDRRWGRLDEVAENCINELINRNMIQPIDIDDDGTVKYCRVHDMVLDLIISLSDEENFATVLNGRICNSFPSKIRRLSMQSSGKEHKGAVGAITETKIHIRSLTVFESDKPIVPHLVDFHALRVLDLFGCDSLENKHVKHIGSSRQLRYLRIGYSKITELPVEIGKLQHLETLDLRCCYSLLRVPSTVVELQKLVRLFVGNKTQLPASGFRSLQALEELQFNETDDPVRFAEEVNESGKCNLRYLHTGEVMVKCLLCNPCSTYPCLQVLKIQPAIGMVPRGIASLKNLVKLFMIVNEFDQEDLQALMGMPSLAHLQLCVKWAIKEEKLTVGSNGFKLLKFFDFQYLDTMFPHSFEEPMSPGGLRLTFAPGAVPALRRIRFDLDPMWVALDFFANLGVEYFSVLAHLEIVISCFQAAPGRVKALECSIEKVIKLNPDREICVRRIAKDQMMKDLLDLFLLLKLNIRIWLDACTVMHRLVMRSSEVTVHALKLVCCQVFLNDGTCTQ